MYPFPIQKLIQMLSHLPSVGPRTAERYVFHLLKSGKKEVTELMRALQHVIETVKSCERCFDFSDRSLCARCADNARDATLLCIVQESQDIPALEKTGAYRGKYHVLRGTLRPDQEEATRELKIEELLARLTKEKIIQEVLLAFNPDVAGETTMLYLERRVKETHPGVRVSRLARGLPMGSDLQYADEVTLQSAIRHRQSS